MIFRNGMIQPTRWWSHLRIASRTPNMKKNHVLPARSNPGKSCSTFRCVLSTVSLRNSMIPFSQLRWLRGFSARYGGFQSHGGSPKVVVYRGNSQKKLDDFSGYPLWNPPIYGKLCQEKVKFSREENQLLQLSAGESHCTALSRSGKVSGREQRSVLHVSGGSATETHIGGWCLI